MEDDQLIPGVDSAFLDVVGPDVAQAAREHDRLVVAAKFGGGRAVRGNGPYRGRDFRLVGAEIAVDGGAAEFVIEGGAAERALDHNVEGGDNAARFAVVLFPRLDRARDAQIGNAEAGEPRLRF